jgi:DNA polymerase III epsilon subunit-like protein
MIKELFCDTETTGTDLMKHGLFMIGGIIRINGVVKQEFSLKCDVFEEDEFAPDAIAKHGFTSEQIRRFPDPYETYLEFVRILGGHVDKFNKQDKFFFINFGAEFDAKFLRRWCESNGDQYFGSWFWHPWIDIMSLAAQDLKKVRHTMPNFQLQTICEKYGVKVDPTEQHRDPLYDARIAMRVYDQIIAKQQIPALPPGPVNPVEMPDGTYQYRLDKGFKTDPRR